MAPWDLYLRKCSSTTVYWPIGATILARLKDVNKNPVQALCNALAAGATSALSAKAGQWAKSAFPESANTTDSSDSTATDASPLEQGMMPACISICLCEQLNKKIEGEEDSDTGEECLVEEAAVGLDQRMPGKCASEEMAKDLGREMIRKGTCRILDRVLDRAGVPMTNAAHFASELENSLRTVNTVDLRAAVPLLETRLLSGTSVISNMIATGSVAGLQLGLKALTQKGAVNGSAVATPKPNSESALRKPLKGASDAGPYEDLVMQGFDASSKILKDAKPLAFHLEQAA
ncbi:hypothetical protein BCR34DRAFT_583196 [Clohesyomyces aquaticus]|uniref:Uncharacterized protein n=1 Tax=Clohesyomyces aquaticus TaxID=1231657 RepID=A0A1Y2A5Y8_9PLEO|nr:hypothetical protein BCR34DRAFT_583196 [Clohesyomyces aquaticus]